jgi:hypothetical protein
LSTPDERAPDLGAERLDVDDDDVDRLDALALELLELLWLVPAGEDPGVDRVVERLDLAAEHRLRPGQIGDGPHLDAVLGEVLACPFGREALDIEHLQAASKGADAVPRRDRQQCSHQRPSVVPGIFGRCRRNDRSPEPVRGSSRPRRRGVAWGRV